MSGVPSLESSIRTCQVDTAWAARAQSDRFLNTDALMCPTWTGRDLAGRPVCPDSFWTKSPGCNSSLDRVSVENHLRPSYYEYVTLNPQGVSGTMYGSGGCEGKAQSQNRAKVLEGAATKAGHFNSSFGAEVIGNCAPGDMGYAMYQQQAREQQAAASKFQTHNMRMGAGFA